MSGCGLARLPGSELDRPVLLDAGRHFERHVVEAYQAAVPAWKRPRGWRSAVARAAGLMTSRSETLSAKGVLPGLYPFARGDAVCVWCSWGGLPARITGEIIWGPGVLFGRVWVRVAGLGMVPASRVKTVRA